MVFSLCRLIILLLLLSVSIILYHAVSSSLEVRIAICDHHYPQSAYFSF